MTGTFDGPSGEACLARRDRSNTPLQALTLLNDEVYIEAARALGRWTAKQPGGSESKIEAIVRKCLTRPPSEKEIAKLKIFYTRQLERLERGELKASEVLNVEENAASAEEAAWTTVARVLMNLDEAISKS